MFVAAMSISCNQKNQEANDSTIDSMMEDTTAVQMIAPEDGEATLDADHQAMLDAAAEAGRAKCNCYKADAASVEACIKSIISEKYAAYEGNEEFMAAMEQEFNTCVKEKATEATKKAVDDGVKAGAKALSEKLGKK